MKHDPALQAPPMNQALLSRAYRGFTPLTRDLAKLEKALGHLQVAGGDAHADHIRALRAEMQAFAPSVTLIGQVKAGKTALANAMAGTVGLLPSDINPWTSVVTSVHLSPRRTKTQEKSSYRFFTDTEWSNLLTTGGRVGELASRAGADQELEKVRKQLEAMRDAARARLGDQFEMLLGQTHDYGYADSELVQRYVCLGDDSDGIPAQGRFADITRSADLYLSQPALPLPLCLRDTPGVNDTFMVREQITVNAIRGSRLCVVVLSAHQALSNVDLALVRLIANVPLRDVVIFVNRIDELADPAKDIPEIRASIEKTLKSLSIPAEAEILFGSAHWANAALCGDFEQMGRDSAAALLNYARYQDGATGQEKDTAALIWALSGLPALGETIAERTRCGDGARLLAGMAAAARNTAGAISAKRAMRERQIVERTSGTANMQDLADAIDRISSDARATLDQSLTTLTADLDLRLGKAQEAFVSRGTTSLIRHLEIYGEDVEWTYEPAGLRLLLKSAYNVYCAKTHKAADAILERAARHLERLFEATFNLSHTGFTLEPPATPEPPVPVMLGQTIALDIRGSWWTRWWRRRRSYDSYAADFRLLIEAEIAPIVTALSSDHAAPHASAVRKALDNFLTRQRGVILSLADQGDENLARLREEQGQTDEQQSHALNTAQAILADFAPVQRERAN
ncbi:dynamin family protein [Gymnodinialimonas hymeniacidonis]|uniref:dynamin family protein n=1 Tax=Gymnodinialimonas hymeniacidonis TaxID=3126508 RepID=UPI0034C693E2